MLNKLRKELRRTLPEPLRRLVALARRGLDDRLSGKRARFGLTRAGDPGWPCAVRIEQPIRQSPLWQGKLANLRLGCALIDGVRIEPGQTFSFWALLGRPSEARGFAIGRAIRADVAGGDIGGGLCQLSGIAYELGLRGGLAVVERHAHSRDLYLDEDERFTPLGLDATVVWPWKDLRLENQLGTPVVLRFGVEEMVLRAWLLAENHPGERAIDLVRSDFLDRREVIVRREGLTVSRDSYAI